MKKYISILELFAGRTIYKLLLIFIGMGALELWMFRDALLQREYGGLEHVVKLTYIPWVFAAGFLLVTAILCVNSCSFGSNSNYILKRLRVSEKKLLILECFYNMMCYVLLLGIQILLLFLMSFWFRSEVTEASNQTTVLAFYRNAFMHSVMPLGGTIRWIENVIMIIGCGVTATTFAYQQRKGKPGIEIGIVVIICLLAFVRKMGDLSNIGLVLSIWIWVVYGLRNMLRREKEDEQGKEPS